MDWLKKYHRDLKSIRKHEADEWMAKECERLKKEHGNKKQKEIEELKRKLADLEKEMHNYR